MIADFALGFGLGALACYVAMKARYAANERALSAALREVTLMQLQVAREWEGRRDCVRGRVN